VLSGPFCVSGKDGLFRVACPRVSALSPLSGLFADGKITPYDLLHNAAGVIIRPVDRIPAPAGQANIITNNGTYERARFFLPNGLKFDIISFVPPILRKE